MDKLLLRQRWSFESDNDGENVLLWLILFTHLSIYYQPIYTYICVRASVCVSINYQPRYSNIVFWKNPLNECELIKRNKQKLVGWKANTVSKAGRLTLIKSNLTGIPNHIMSCFKCPDRVTKKIIKSVLTFFGEG